MRTWLKRALVRTAFVAAVVTVGSIPIASQFVPTATQAAHNAVADGCAGGPGPCIMVR